MRQLLLCLTLSLFTMMLVGCGGGESLPYTDNSKDPESYAKDVKLITIQAVRGARASSEPIDSLDPLVAELESSNKRPVGSYQATYTEVLALAKEARDACAAANGKPSGLEGMLKKLEQSVESLPGEVPPERKD